jgi:hypothetical protein
MTYRLKFALIIVVLLLLLTATPIITLASPPGFSAPSGFYLVSSAVGVELYRKDYPGGNPDFVQVVALDQGAQVRLLYGEISEQRTGQGAYGGDDPRIESQRLKKYWNSIAAQSPNAFCVSNGQFFFMQESPTRLPFPLKVGGVIVSDGYGKKDFPGQQLMLELWKNKADIKVLTKDDLYTSSAPNIVVGLAEDARKSPTKYVARTFMGVDDRNGDGRFETVLVFNTKSARQKDAAQVLRDFGAEKVMMLDGGGSTQLFCQDSSYVNSDRLIPQAVAVIAGDGSINSGQQAAVFGISDSREISPIEQAQSEINLSDTKWILFAALPVALIMVLAISRIERRVYYY